MEISTKTRSRKPIFDSKKSQSKQSKLYQTTPSFFQASVTPSPQVPYHSRIIYEPRPTPMTRSNSITNPSTPSINIKVCSPQPGHYPRPVQHIQRSSTPVAKPVYCISRASHSPLRIVHQQQLPQSHQPLQRHEQQLIQRSIRQDQSEVWHQRQLSEALRRSDVRPTLVAVERVMKPIGENQESRQVTVIKPQFTQSLSTFNYSTSSGFSEAREPREVLSYEKVQRKSSDFQTMHKLSQMNNLLSQSYDNLYEELQHLKGERTAMTGVQDRNIIQEDLFLKKTFCQIQSIFNLCTHDTLSKMSRIERECRENTLQRKSELKASRIR